MNAEASAISDIHGALRALGVTDSTLTAQEKKALDEQGYLILPGVIDKAWLEQMRAAFEQLDQQRREGAGDPGRQESGTRHVDDLATQGEVFERVYTHPRLLAAAYHVLKRAFKLANLHGRDPLPGYGQQGLHADWGPRERGEPFQVVTSLFCLDDFTAENGATRLVPGSHLLTGKLDKKLLQPGYQHPHQVQALAPAGAVIIFNGHLLHSGTRNMGRVSRRALQCVFIAREQAHFARKPLSFTGDLSPAVRYILGSPAPTRS